MDRADLILIGANIGATDVHMAGATLEELYKQHDEEVLCYKARISFLESRVGALIVKEDGSSSSAPVVLRDEYLQSLQAQKDAVVEEARNAELCATQISTANQEMQVTVGALQEEVDKLCYQLESANRLVAEYAVSRDRTEELEEGNERLKKYLLTSLEEQKKMKTSTLLAIARAWQYEVEFETIQHEWNRNSRVWHMMLTSWPKDEKMYPSTWDDQDPLLTLRSESIN